MSTQTTSAKQIWDTALGALQVQVTKANYNTWLKDTTGLGLRDGHFVVGVPSAFAREWLDKRLRSLVKRTLTNIVGREIEVQFQEGTGASGAPANLAEPQDLRGLAVQEAAPASCFNTRYTFNSFVVGNCNQVAHAAALAVAATPGKTYNPLFIYGGAGLGKTHLLHAIGHVISDASHSFLYVTSEQFTNDFVTSIKERKTEEFRSRYRSVDVLLLDDVQFLAGKEQTQEGLFHTFNELHNDDRQIVITCDRHPKALGFIEDRLRSRFEWGLTADVQPPDLETRQAILAAKAEAKGAQIPREILEFVARKVRRNIRELEGALNRVIACSELTGTAMSMDLAAKALSEMPGEAPWKRIMPAQVVNSVADYYKLSPLLLTSPKREKPLTQARQVAMYILREDIGLTLAEIGQVLGGRDHKTVHHGYGRIASAINDDLQLRQDVLEIRDRLLQQAADHG